jgi:hypothetical protein
MCPKDTFSRGAPLASSAAMQNNASIVIDMRRDSTRRENRSSTSARSTKTLRIAHVHYVRPLHLFGRGISSPRFPYRPITLVRFRFAIQTASEIVDIPQRSPPTTARSEVP